MAPGIGQVILLMGEWHNIFIFMGLLAAAFWVWTFIRLPETLPTDQRRPLSFGAVVDGFRVVFTNRVAISYGLAGTFLFGALFALSSLVIPVVFPKVGPEVQHIAVLGVLITAAAHSRTSSMSMRPASRLRSS